MEGEQMDRRHLETLKKLIETKAVLKGDFTLASGLKSAYYFDGKKATYDPAGALVIGELVFSLISAAGAEAVGGMTLGSDAIAVSAALTSYLKGKPIPAFSGRREAKSHGTQRFVEGNLPANPGAKVAIVDDVITTGGSVEKAIAVVEELGYKVAKVVVVVDRNQGGSVKLRQKGYDVQALLSADDKGDISVPSN